MFSSNVFIQKQKMEGFKGKSSTVIGNFKSLILNLYSNQTIRNYIGYIKRNGLGVKNLILDTSLLLIEYMALSKLLNFVAPHQVLLIFLWYICISQACTDHYRLMTAVTGVHPLSLFTTSALHPNAILLTSARMVFL